MSFVKKLLNPKFIAKKFVRVARDAYWDWRYGGWCGGTKESKYAHLGANKTQSTEYIELRTLFKRANLQITAADVLVDIGCGKGRVINYWLMTGQRNRMVGIEIDEDIARQARQRLHKYPNVTILTGDAVALLPADGTVFYLWNTFKTDVVRRFKARLMEVCGHRGNVTIVYYFCEGLEAFKDDPAWSIECLDRGPGLSFPSAIIRIKRPSERTVDVTV